MPHLALIPGLNNTHAVFDLLCPLLPTDITAHTESSPPHDTVEAIAQSWLDRLPERFHLLGFSFGGYVALAIQQMAPQRVQGLALLCTSPGSDSSDQVQNRLTMIDQLQSGTLDYLTLVCANPSNAFHPDTLNRQDILARRLTMVAEYGMERFIAHLRACMQRPARDDVWRSALNPLLVAGSHDRLLKPQKLRELAASRPGCAFHLIEGAGHLVPLEQPQALADIVVPWVRGSS